MPQQSNTRVQRPRETWTKIPVGYIEDLSEAVAGAGLQALQLSNGGLSGSLAFGIGDGITYSSGYLGGHVSLIGALSETMVTLGVGIDLGDGSRHWQNEVQTGDIGVFMAGDEHNSIYTPGSLYACATLAADKLEAVAADLGLVLEARQLGGSGISPRQVDKRALSVLRHAFATIHAGRPVLAESGRSALECMIRVLAREPRRVPGVPRPNSHARVVARAQNYILEHLEHPLTIHAIADAAFASQATLYRAFHEVLAETPQSFVRKLRLNRIRRDLVTDAEVLCTITIIANRWGISELGRFAGWYRELFNELPSRTRIRVAQALRRDGPKVN